MVPNDYGYVTDFLCFIYDIINRITFFVPNHQHWFCYSWGLLKFPHGSVNGRTKAVPPPPCMPMHAPLPDRNISPRQSCPGESLPKAIIDHLVHWLPCSPLAGMVCDTGLLDLCRPPLLAADTCTPRLPRFNVRELFGCLMVLDASRFLSSFSFASCWHGSQAKRRKFPW